MEIGTKIAIFKGRKIRKVIYNNEWWFSVIDVVLALTDSVNSRDYWFKVKIRVKSEDGVELSTICRQLKLGAEDGKMRETDCANTEGILRIIQSVPSPKAEPFKCWLARVGYERIQETEDPELATKRTRMLYKLKGRYAPTALLRVIGTSLLTSNLALFGSGNYSLNIDQFGRLGLGATSPYAMLSPANASVATSSIAIRPISSQTANILDIYNPSGSLTDVITSANKWGMGTTSPYAKLSVVGPVVAEYIHATSTTATSTFAGGALFATGGGNVGIGTTTPTTQLQVTNSSSNATSTLTVGKGNQNKGTCLELFDSAGTAVYAYVAAGATAFTLLAVSCK